MENLMSPSNVDQGSKTDDFFGPIKKIKMKMIWVPKMISFRSKFISMEQTKHSELEFFLKTCKYQTNLKSN